MTGPEPGAFDPDLSLATSAVEGLGELLATWQARAEPDAPARRAGSAAITAIDTATAALYRIRARLITETRRADDEAAAREGPHGNRVPGACWKVHQPPGTGTAPTGPPGPPRAPMMPTAAKRHRHGQATARGRQAGGGVMGGELRCPKCHLEHDPVGVARWLWLFRDIKPKPPGKGGLVLVMLAARMDPKTGCGWTTDTDLAGLAGCSRAAVERATRWGRDRLLLHRASKGHRITDVRGEKSCWS